MKGLWMVFVSIFLAELGDKTQLATLLFATDARLNKWGIFLAASLALVVSCSLAVLLGTQLSHLIAPEKLRIAAGMGFVGIGVWTLWNSW